MRKIEQHIIENFRLYLLEEEKAEAEELASIYLGMDIEA